MSKYYRAGMSKAERDKIANDLAMSFVPAVRPIDLLPPETVGRMATALTNSYVRFHKFAYASAGFPDVQAWIAEQGDVTERELRDRVRRIVIETPTIQKLL